MYKFISDDADEQPAASPHRPRSRTCSLVAVAEDLVVHFAQVVALFAKHGIVSSKYDLKDAVIPVTFRDLLNSLLQELVCLGEAGHNLRVVLRTA